MAYKGLKLAGNGILQISDRKRGGRSCVLCFAVILWSALLIPTNLEAETGIELADSTRSEMTTQKVYRLPPPGADPRIRYLLVGVEFFHSRELKKAREAFEKVLDLDSQSAQAHYFLGLIEHEEGNIEEAKTRFQIAHECLGLSSEFLQLPINAKQALIEFPDEYEPRMYYRDGWYVSPKDPGVANSGGYSLEAGSTYRVELKLKRNRSLIHTGIVGLIVAFSFFLAR